MTITTKSVLMVGTAILAFGFQISESKGDASSGLITLSDTEFGLFDATAVLSYDAVENQLVGVTENVALSDLTQGIDAIDDLTGSFTVSAGIDENGVMSSGTYVWTGGSAANGIPGDTLLMAGNLYLFTYPKFLRPQFIADVQFINIDLMQIMGPIKTVLWTGANSAECVPSFPDQNLTCSWVDQSPPLVTTIEFISVEYTDIDSDLDLIQNNEDNCTLVPNFDQVDTDQDGIGNRCDADFNQDCVVNFLDVSLFADEFLGSNELFDLNDDGAVNFVDYGTVAESFLQPPGPGQSDVCVQPANNDKPN